MSNKECKEKDLEKVAGGREPEEFDWHHKGYVTPEKPQDDGKHWHFEAIGDNIKNFFKNFFK